MKKQSLLIALAVALFFAYSYRYFWLKKFKTKNKEGKALVTVVENSKLLTIATCDELEKLVAIIEASSPQISFLSMMPEEDQVKAYSDYIIDQFIISSYLTKKYIQKNKINERDSFKEEYERYSTIMESNFLNQYLKKEILESLNITNDFAKEYYNANKDSIFASKEFTKETPGSDLYVINMDPSKSLKDYEAKLKSKKDGKLIKGINKSFVNQGFSEEIIETINAMKINEISEIILPQGVKIAAYKIAEHKGSWLPYEKVEENVKKMIAMVKLNDNYKELMDKLRSEYKVSIDLECLKGFLRNKASIMKDPELLENAAKRVEEEIITEAAVEKAKDEIEKELKKNEELNEK